MNTELLLLFVAGLFGGLSAMVGPKGRGGFCFFLGLTLGPLGMLASACMRREEKL